MLRMFFWLLAASLGSAAASAQEGAAAAAPAASSCSKPVYLTLDTGHMGVANQIAEVLHKTQVKVTFFAANERTKEGDGSLGDYWAPWWRARL